MSWFNEQIKQRNHLINRRCVELVNYCTTHGYNSIILKGQANALMYPNPFSRMPGDIDIWLDATRNQITEFVRNTVPNAKASFLHIDFPLFTDVEVEVHFTPFYSIVCRRRHAIEEYIKNERARQFDNSIMLIAPRGFIRIPTDDFNIILQLLHMQKHFFRGGIGLRHIIDFYYLLIREEKENAELRTKLNDFGLTKFSRAIMWILRYILKIDTKYLIESPDEKRGRLLMDEIIRTGNFGQNDSRGFKKISKYSTTLSLFIRNIRLVWLFPEEAIFAPIAGLFYRN